MAKIPKYMYKDKEVKAGKPKTKKPYKRRCVKDEFFTEEGLDSSDRIRK